MKRLCSFFLSFLLVTPCLFAGPNDPTEVGYAELKVAPEEYKGKLVTYSEVFRDFSTAFPRYISNAGFRSPPWILLSFGDRKLPALMKKNDEQIKLIAGLKPNKTEVIVTGRVRKLRLGPRDSGHPPYYVEITKLEPVPVKQPPQPPPQQAKPRRAPIKPAEPPSF